MGNNYYGTSEPSCSWFRSFASDTAGGNSIWGAGKVIPDDADSLRFHLHVSNWFDSVAHTPAPLFDNIRIGLSNKATILHVPSPSYMTIQAAIDAADEGDTVLVRTGVYTGTGNKDLHFNGLDIVLMSEDGPYATVIDCEGAGRGMEILAGQDTSTIVQGFTFKNGDGFGADGGGVYVEYSPVRFVDCIFDSNSTSMSGGGVYVFGDAQFFGCYFTNNSAFDQGAGVAVMFGNPLFYECLFEKNDVVTTGGGVSVGAGNPYFFNCFIDSNTTDVDGGGVYINGGTPIFEGGRIHGNDAQLNGGGIFAINTNGIFNGCEISSNTAFQYGGGIMDYGDIEVNNCAIILNYSTDEGGGVYITGGNPSFNTCYILENGTLADGGGVVVTGSSTATFIGGAISHNNATLNAGGVFVYSATPTFFGCEISFNGSSSAATWGGGVMATGGSFLACAIINNESLNDGGGISVPSGSPVFQDCWIAGNDAMNGGGAAIAGTASPEFTRCVITGNRGQWEGGGLSIEMAGPGLPDISSCTIADNLAGNGGGGGVRVVNNLRTAFVIPLLQTIIWGNCSSGQGDQVYVTSAQPNAGVSFTCCDVDSTGMDTDANGIIQYLTDNIFVKPWFCLPVECALAPIVAGDYALPNASPCLASNSPCLQLIGALDEGCTATDVPEEEDVSLPTEYCLFQNAPNPFNPTTQIAFELPRSGRVVLRVYDVTGSLIRTLTDGTLPRARHSVMWDGCDENGRPVASGIYFYRLTAPGFTATKKMILLK
jgi:hypothetical protein